MAGLIVPEPSSDARYELNKNVFALRPTNVLSTSLCEEVRGSSFREINRRPFDE